jgi:hypothetical protein
MNQKELSDKIAESMGLGGLLLQNIMPILYWLMLVKGEKYECGSDYPDYALEALVGDCGYCENTGILWRPLGQEAEPEPCDCVWGAMKMYRAERSVL